jgi:hypothetical protein
LSIVFLVLLALGLTAVAPFAGLLLGPWWTRAICALGVGSILVLIAAARRQNGMAWYHGLLMPFAALFLGVALIRSVWMTYRRGGVSWRDHLYPLADLRAHVKRRDAWLRELWLSTR